MQKETFDFTSSDASYRCHHLGDMWLCIPGSLQKTKKNQKLFFSKILNNKLNKNKAES